MIDKSGNVHLRLDSGHALAFNIKENPHLDYGHAVTSHSSQGQTADRVLIHIDTEQSGEKLVNRRLAKRVGVVWPLRRPNHVSRQTAMDQMHTTRLAAENVEPSLTLQNGAQQTIMQGLNIAR